MNQPQEELQGTGPKQRNSLSNLLSHHQNPRFISHSANVYQVLTEDPASSWNPVTYGGHQPRVAAEHLKYGWSILRHVRVKQQISKTVGQGCKMSQLYILVICWKDNVLDILV